MSVNFKYKVKGDDDKIFKASKGVAAGMFAGLSALEFGAATAIKNTDIKPVYKWTACTILGWKGLVNALNVKRALEFSAAEYNKGVDELYGKDEKETHDETDDLGIDIDVDIVEDEETEDKPEE